MGKTYLKLHTFSGAYGFYFYSTNAEVLSERSSLTLLLPLWEGVTLKMQVQIIAVSKQKLSQSRKGERKRQLWSMKGKKEKKWTSQAGGGGEGKKTSVSADKPYLEKLIRLNSCKNMSVL